MSTLVRRLWRDETAEGTTSGALRIALWVVVALAVVGIVGAKIISAGNAASSCLNAAATASSTSVSGGTIPSCGGA